MNITEKNSSQTNQEDQTYFKDQDNSNEFIIRQKRKVESYSPRFEPIIKVKDFSCQVDLESKEISILRLELERMKDFQKKYDQCKKILKKVQQEYRELYNLFNIQLEDKESQISELIKEIMLLKENNLEIDKESLLLQAENQTLRDLNKKTLTDESKSFHTFQYTSNENINPPEFQISQLQEKNKEIQTTLQPLGRV